MRLSLLISLSLLLLSWQRVGAQIAPADDFFHSGAQFYISNNIPQAKQMVDMGLKLYPDDEKLKKLEQLLNQQQQQQQQQNQSQQDQQQSQQQKSDSQKNQQQQNQQQQQQQNQSQDQQKQDEQKQKQADQQKNDQQKQQDQQKGAGEKPDKDKQDADGQPGSPTQMTPEEAKRLLDAQKDNEQVLQWKPAGKPRDPSRPVKDW